MTPVDNDHIARGTNADNGHVTVIDDHTVRVDLNERWAVFPNTFLTGGRNRGNPSLTTRHWLHAAG
jgi:hypothetical protein